MKRPIARLLAAAALIAISAPASLAEDIDGVQEHPMFERYPGQDIRWQEIHNYMPYKVAVGPVTGYRQIGEWIETEGRVTRTFFADEGQQRTYSEIYANYLEALEAEDFEILGQGISADRSGTGVGSRQWFGIAYRANPVAKPGEVGTMFAGSSTSGGAGSIVARKERAAGTAYVVLTVEQHSDELVGTLIDIVEVEAAETGLVSVSAEAIGSDIAEYGRVVLDGIVFAFDSAELLDESAPALQSIAQYLADHPDTQFYVVGHTDSVGTFAHNRKLSADRAMAVVEALQQRHDIESGRLEPHGVGPLVPVFSNESDAGREKNRRVELVERRSGE